MFYEVGLLKNFEKLTGKHLCQGFFFLMKLRTIKPATLLKKRLQRRCFTVDFAKFLKAPSRTPPVNASAVRATFLILRPRKTYIYVFPPLIVF